MFCFVQARASLYYCKDIQKPKAIKISRHLISHIGQNIAQKAKMHIVSKKTFVRKQKKSYLCRRYA